MDNGRFRSIGNLTFDNSIYLQSIYIFQAMDVDQFVVDNPDFVVITAVGDAGETAVDETVLFLNFVVPKLYRPLLYSLFFIFL